MDSIFEKTNDFIHQATATKEEKNTPVRSIKVPKSVKPVKEKSKSQAKEKKVKAVKPPKKQKQVGEQVEKTSLAVDFIKRYANLNGKIKTKKQVLSLLGGLQKAILERRIRKTDEHAETITHIQDELIRLCNGMRGSVKIEFSNVEKYKSIGNSEAQMIAIKLLKRYVNLQGKEGVDDKIMNLLKQMQKALVGMDSSNKYFTKLEAAVDNLSNTSGKLKISIQELNGLKGITPYPIIAAQTAKVVKKGIKKVIKDCNLNGLDNQVDPGKKKISNVDGFVRADQRTTVKSPDTFRLPGEMGKFIQDIQPFKYSIVITGDPHAGKTELVTQLIDAFTSVGKTVGMFSIEQGGMESKDTRKAIDRNIKPNNQKLLQVTGEAKDGILTLKKFADEFDVIVVDSFQKLKVPSTAFDTLRHEHPNTIWVIIFQQNGEGGTRGGVSPDYDSPCHIKVHLVDNTFKNNYAEMKKNRGNALNLKYNVFHKKTSPLNAEQNES